MRYYDRRLPLEIMARKTVVSKEASDEIAFEMLTALDAAKKGLAPYSMSNTLCEHLLASALLWKASGNKALLNRSQAAWDAMTKACGRPGPMLSLTTTEYQAIRISIGYYLRNLVKIEVGKLYDAYDLAADHIGIQSRACPTASCHVYKS